jgi:hypothetical protein
MKRIFIVIPVVLALLTGSALPVYAQNTKTPTAIAVMPAKLVLAIKAPASAQAGEPVTITVYETKSNAPVSGVKVWALPASSMSATTASTNDTASYAVKYGLYLGETDKAGQVITKFEKAGQYILAAVKDGYAAGLSKIAIIDKKALAVRAPSTVKVLQSFSLRVVENTVLTVEIPVPKADVWALDTVAAAVLNGSSDLAATAQKQGIHLGYTNEDGYLNPEPVLSRAGTYWLIALKDGYTPAITKIIVNGPVTATPTTKPVTTTPTTTKPPTTKPNTGISAAASVTSSVQTSVSSTAKK